MQCATHSRDVRVLSRSKSSTVGRGFANDDVPRLFGTILLAAKRGTGLGLALVQQIVTEHAGEVTAVNRAGGGSEVTLSIPLPRE